MDKKCASHGCKNAGRYKVRQANGFIGYRCAQHVKGERVIEQVDLERESQA